LKRTKNKMGNIEEGIVEQIVKICKERDLEVGQIVDLLPDEEQEELLEQLTTTCICGNTFEDDSDIEIGICKDCR